MVLHSGVISAKRPVGSRSLRIPPRFPRSNYAELKLAGLSELLLCQSSGGDSIPHTLPGSSSMSPRIQNFLYSPTGIQFTTRAMTLVLTGRPSN